jgi:hypothetical protein
MQVPKPPKTTVNLPLMKIHQSNARYTEVYPRKTEVPYLQRQSVESPVAAKNSTGPVTSRNTRSCTAVPGNVQFSHANIMIMDGQQKKNWIVM